MTILYTFQMHSYELLGGQVAFFWLDRPNRPSTFLHVPTPSEAFADAMVQQLVVKRQNDWLNN